MFRDFVSKILKVVFSVVLLACVASVSVWFRSKERGTRVKDLAKIGVSFLARSKPRIPFLGLSLLRNQTKTLATQAIVLFDSGSEF